LQESDSKRLAWSSSCRRRPAKSRRVEARIAAEKAAIEAAKAEWHALESKKKLLEVEIKSAEAKRANTARSSFEVRKNDEYKALTHEIETPRAAIAGFEEES